MFCVNFIQFKGFTFSRIYHFFNTGTNNRNFTTYTRVVRIFRDVPIYIVCGILFVYKNKYETLRYVEAIYMLHLITPEMIRMIRAE